MIEDEPGRTGSEIKRIQPHRPPMPSLPFDPSGCRRHIVVEPEQIGWPTAAYASSANCRKYPASRCIIRASTRTVRASSPRGARDTYPDSLQRQRMD